MMLIGTKHLTEIPENVLENLHNPFPASQCPLAFSRRLVSDFDSRYLVQGLHQPPVSAPPELFPYFDGFALDSSGASILWFQSQ